jgi:hypothetical protein
MTTRYLSLRLCSDATFGRGDGIPGLVDIEIDHDANGCPQVGGRVLKGLLREELNNIRYALSAAWEPWQLAAEWLFGRTGALHDGAAQMRVGAARLPPSLHAELVAAVNKKTLRSEDVLLALTDIRRQTAVDARTGAPETGSLRAMRVLLRETQLLAPLTFYGEPPPLALPLLAACTLGVRRGGSVRNRGRGRLALLLHEQEPDDYTNASYTRSLFEQFRETIGVAQPAGGR